VNRDYLGVLAAKRMLRPGLRPQDLDYALSTIVFGFFAAEPFLPPGIRLSLEQNADQLARSGLPESDLAPANWCAAAITLPSAPTPALDIDHGDSTVDRRPQWRGDEGDSVIG
jgi:hypothetical protein